MADILKPVGMACYIMGVAIFFGAVLFGNTAPVIMFVVNFLGSALFLWSSVIDDDRNFGFNLTIFGIQLGCLVTKLLIM